MCGRMDVLVGGVMLALAAACTNPADKAEAPAASGAAAGTLAEPTVAEIRSSIEMANQRSVAAMLAGDLNGSLANYADSAVVMMPMMPAMHGRAAIEAGFKGMMESMKINAVTFTTQDVIASGDLAVETGAFNMTSTMKGAKAMNEKGKYLTIWKRQGDGTWKIVRDINNPDGPTTAGTAK